MQTNLPVFSQITIADVEKNLSALLKNNIDAIDALLAKNTVYTWDNLLAPIENISDALHRFWSPIQHMNAVVDTPELRETVRACLPKLSDYHTHIAHNEKLFRAIESIRNSDVFSTLNFAQQKSIENDLRDFKLGGVALPADQKKQFAALSKSLSQHTQQFEENVLDATMAWKKHIIDEKLLSGIPEHAKSAAKEKARLDNTLGWTFTLEAPDYLAVMSYADSATLREEMYYAYATRASDVGPTAKQFDNSQLMHDIVRDRFEMARLLGYQNYAEYSLATKMVKKPADVIAFLNELADKSLKKARDEFQVLSQFAKKELGIERLNAWDVPYASEKLRQKEYAISQEDLRPYFPEPAVLQGLFDILNRLYDVTVERVVDTDVWHSDVKCVRLLHNNKVIAHLFFDLYARQNKRGGAWMDECVQRRRLDNGEIELPAAYINCNFNAPIGHDPALFTHSDVETLFHECGHALQHVLTQIDVANVSGIRGIPWDAVEIASQFFENWAWEKESVAYFSRHYQTNEMIPDALFQRMERAKNFQSAMQMVRQLEFALFDFYLHVEFDEHNPACIQSILNRVRDKMAVYPVPDFNRFQHGFLHIFSGGYAAGYYSYKWAEVMACDAFSLFEEKGIFNHDVSTKFKNTFLESGGAKEPMDVFIAFRGRAPSVDALLRQSGIA